MGTIPSTDITIDGDTAWLVVRNQDGWFWETDHNRPCDTCNGHGHVRQRLHDAPGTHRPVTCPDCHGTGRHTFTLDVGCPLGPHWKTGNPHWPNPCPECFGMGTRTITVHVVEVLPIVDAKSQQQTVFADIIDWGEKHRRNSPTRFVYIPANQTIAGTYLPTFPDSAAPGKHAVHLAIKEKDAP